MRQLGLAALVAVAGWLLPGGPAYAQRATPDAPVTFADVLGEGQIDEVIAVWSAGRLLGTLHVRSGHEADSFTMTLPPGPFEYALCGMLRRKGPDGTVTNHPIDNAGRVVVAPGAVLRAMTLDDVVFALAAPDQQPVVGNTPVCSAAIS